MGKKKKANNRRVRKTDISSKHKGQKKKELYLTIGAHNDDYIIGAGGALAKYQKEGKDFYSVIFSYGEKSLPYYQEKVSISMRVKESIRADKILGGSGVTYLGISEGRFLEDESIRKAKDTLKKIIKEKKPKKIFTHSSDDAHPDHRAVNKIVKELLDEINYKGDLYSFDVWKITNLNFNKKDKPQLVVDITDTFKAKIKAFRAHKSQRMAILSLMWNVYLKAILKGLENGYRYCEVFDKIN